MKTMLMALVACAVLVLSSPAMAADECTLEDWRWQYEPMMDWITIEGVVSCETATMALRVYDENDKFLGVDPMAVIQGGVFMSIIDGVSQAPGGVRIKGKISPGWF